MFITPEISRIKFGMRNRTRSIHDSARPLNARLLNGQLTRKKVADHFGFAQAAVTNWLARGISAKELPKVAALCGITYEEYLREAGIPGFEDKLQKLASRQDAESEIIQTFRMNPSLQGEILAFCRGITAKQRTAQTTQTLIHRKSTA